MAKSVTRPSCAVKHLIRWHFGLIAASPRQRQPNPCCGSFPSAIWRSSTAWSSSSSPASTCSPARPGRASPFWWEPSGCSSVGGPRPTWSGPARMQPHSRPSSKPPTAARSSCAARSPHRDAAARSSTARSRPVRPCANCRACSSICTASTSISFCWTPPRILISSMSSPAWTPSDSRSQRPSSSGRSCATNGVASTRSRKRRPREPSS